MPFTSPLALLGLLFIPAVLAMYMLKLRRDQAVVPSTLLWSRLLTDVEANAPWQRLRRSLLLLLQLLLVVILALLAARPFLERPAGLARDIVLILDTSASMAATDVAPTRLDAAKAAAIESLRDLPTGGKVSVIAADRSARIVVNESSDLGRVQAGDQRPAAVVDARRTWAMRSSSRTSLRPGPGDAQVLVATDAAIATMPTTKVDAPVTVLPVGRDRKNQAIVALAVRTAPSTVTRSVFVSVANLDLETAQRRIEVWGDGNLLEARDVLLDPQARSDVVIDDVPNEVRSLEIRLVGRDPASTAAPDQLAIDDRAWAVIPPDRTRLILVVGEGDPYLETALSFLPNVELYGVTPAEYGTASARKDGRPWDLVIFDAALPTTLPRQPDPRHRAAPDEPARPGRRHAQGPGHRVAEPGRADPALRGPVNDPHRRGGQAGPPRLGKDRHPGPEGRAAPVRRDPGRPADRRPGLRAAPVRPPAPGGLPDPAREPDRRTARRFGGADRGRRARDAGHADDPVRSDRPHASLGRMARRSDLVPAATGGSLVTFARTELVGIYTATPILGAGSTAAPSVGSGAPASAAPSAASPAPGIGGRERQPAAGRGPVRAGALRGRPVRRG